MKHAIVALLVAATPLSAQRVRFQNLGPVGYSTGGLLRPAGDVDNDGVADEFHPERVQLLLFSVFGIAAYVFATMDVVAASTATLTVLPDIPDELLMIMGASNTFYLSGKFGRSVARG